VVAGEGSGDLLGARVVERLHVSAFGLGGPLLARAGVELTADFRGMTAMGIAPAARRSAATVRALAALARGVHRESPRAALLVGLSEVNARLAPLLKRRGVRVLWYSPPQVWAWRPRRAGSIARACDHLSLLLPFELPLWTQNGASAEYVGHPALESLPPLPRPTAALDSPAPTVVLLPGSRPHEVRAHLHVLLAAGRRLVERHRARALVVRAPALDEKTATYVVTHARAAGIDVTDAPLADAAARADVALVASGTATLECAVLGVPPVIVYRTDAVTFAVARRLVQTPFIGLPNLVLKRAAFPELVQAAFTPKNVVDAALDVLRTLPFHRAACAEARTALLAGLDGRPPSERVAATLSEWLS
jgi:lipid-A-disaccharide synthase